MQNQGKKTGLGFGVALAVLLAASGIARAQWTRIGDGSGNTGTAPSAGPAAATTCLLLTDGSAMCQEDSNPCCSGVDPTQWWRLTPDSSGHYETGNWSKLQKTPAGTPNYGPLFYCSAVLADGRVVVIGGEDNLTVNSMTPAVELTLGYIFDPTQNGGTGQWSSAISLGSTGWTQIGDSICAVLPDKTFIIGDNANMQIAKLDLSTQTLALVNSPALENSKADNNGQEGWTLLPDGTILTVDTGTQGGTGFELYCPNNQATCAANQTWTTLAGKNTVVSLVNNNGMNIVPEMGPQVLRPDGTVIAFGANGNNSVYSTSTQSWTQGPSFPSGQESADGPATLLPGGNVLVIASPFFSKPANFYEFDGSNLNPVTGSPNASNEASFNSRMLLLPSGQVLFTDSTGDVELYTNPGTPQDAWRPTITSAPNSVDPGQTYTLSGTQFNGLSQASMYGDDATMATNYPLVRIVNKGNTLYARTHDHSTMGVATGGAPVSTFFDAPAGLDTTVTSQLFVVANGIPSQPFIINGPGLSIPGPVSISACDGTSSTATLNICNTGKQDLSIDDITSSDPQVSVTPPSSGYSLVISPDACFPFQVQFTPTKTGTTNATLTVTSNDPNTPSEQVQVTATAPAPSINATLVSSGNFGSVCPGGETNLSLEVTNQGSCNLVISGIASSNSANFLTPNVNLPLTLSADATVSLPITFQPAGAACSNTVARTGTITIASNDPATPSLIENVTGLVPCPKINATIANTGGFGNVCSGNQEDLTLQVLNQGQCNLDITSITLSDPTDFVLPTVQLPLVLSADANANLPIRFKPTGGTCSNTVPRTSTVTVNNNDPSQPAFMQTVSGIEGCPQLVLSPQNLTGAFAFPATVSDPTGTLGCHTDEQITVSNSGICPLTITSLTAGPSNTFNVINPTVPLSLGPGAGPVPITVRFKPTNLTGQLAMAPDQETGTLTIVSNDPVTVDNSAALCGEPTVHSGVRVLVVNSSNLPVNPLKSLSLSSHGLHPGVSETLDPAVPATALVCGNAITYDLDNELLPPAGTTGNNPNASYILSAKEGNTAASMSFTLGQCDMKQFVMQIK